MEELGKQVQKKEHFEKSSIEIKRSSIHGFGVFAAKNIAPKEVIEECPVIIFRKLMLEYREVISDREFYWDGRNNAIALGYGSMYNHDGSSNARFVIDRQNQAMNFIATKPIIVGTEILVNYGDDWFGSRKSYTGSFKQLDNSSSLLKVIVLLLFLLVLSRVFPFHVQSFSRDAKAAVHQPALSLNSKKGDVN
jgi:SET domain-containing protein